MDPGLPGLVLEVAFRIDSSLPTQQLAERIERVVQRHAALRQRFELQDGHYWIEQAPPETTAYCRIRRLDKADNKALLPANRAHIGTESRRLFHADVVEAANGQRYLVFRVHHAIADLWSVGLLIRDFAADRATPEIRQISPSPRIDAQFWHRIGGQNAPLSLPMATPHASHDRRNKTLFSFVIDQKRSAALHRLAKASACTPYAIFLAAQALTLATLGQSSQPALAITHHGRHRYSREQVGYFANTLTIPFDVNEGDVSTFIRQTADRLRCASKACANAGYPELVQRMAAEGLPLTPPSCAVIFQQDMPGMPRGLAAALLGMGPVQLGEMTLTAVIPPPSIGPFANALLLTQYRGALHGRVEVDPARHPDWLAQAIAERFSHIVAFMADNPHAMLSTLPPVPVPAPKPSRSDVLPATETLIANILRQVALCPNTSAVITPQSTLSYAQLARQTANTMAGLRHKGVQPGQAVAILLPRDQHLIPTLLAVMACGANYIPLNENNTVDFNLAILNKARCQTLITNANAITSYRAIMSCWSLDELQRFDTATAIDDRSTLQATAYTLFTSGSTGEPKGVAISHANAANLLRWAAREYRPEELAYTLAVTPLTFDLSIFELFAPLSVGGCVKLAPSVLSLIDTPQMVTYATLLNTVPSAAEALLQHKAFGNTLRVLNLAGEPLHHDLYLRLQKHLPTTRIVNLYGPTETTTYSTGLTITPEQRDITIGTPLYGTWVDVVDEDLQSVGMGVPGELIIYGQGVAQGYVGDPMRSASAFLPAPGGSRCYRTGDRVRWLPDGRIDYLGRQDDQIKIRGFRVELGAIQTALHAIETIREAAVITTGNKQQRNIMAFIALAETTVDEHTALQAIKQQLLAVLPSYAIPEKWQFLAALPRNQHGKIDRNTLLKQQQHWRNEPAKYNARPMTEVEQRIAACWQQILGGEIGLYDHFLECGGHSLSLTQLTGLLRQEFNMHILLQDLWARPTVEQQAALITTLHTAEQTGNTPAPIPRLNRKNFHH
ncbi:amino acid adenylation domain-containing protein [Serratia rubidaea]|uniref:amino acid adenylation domain-containing protein n=1 Tax=Serratia rubidaea TaxID=61652 RepID=UPI0022B91107|nr:amino acid adenylation domain-containing protein [Serratia rubidaea]WBF45735.1 amino acid adenylation domain-containing protein [Serratia rubidaea]